jgi:hypothetical protein
MRGNSDRLRTFDYTDDSFICCKLAITACELEPLSNRRLYCVRYAFLFFFTFKGAIVRKTLLALSVLAGLAGGTAATPADAAPLAHCLLPSVEALLPVANTAADAALNEGASVQTVQYYRRYGRRSYYGRRHYSRY